MSSPFDFTGNSPSGSTFGPYISITGGTTSAITITTPKCSYCDSTAAVETVGAPSRQEGDRIVQDVRRLCAACKIILWDAVLRPKVEVRQ